MSEAKTETVTLSKLESNTAHLYNHPLWRKCLIVFATSWMALAATFSSTALLPAAPYIADAFGSTSTVIDGSSAGVFAAMSISSLVWGPIGNLIGKRLSYNLAIAVLFLFTIGVALSQNLTTFIVLRVLSGIQGTYFHVMGQAIIATYFPPVQRGTATGFFLAGTVLGPPLGPCIASIIVTFYSWRVIMWLQAGLVGAGLVMSLVFLPRGGGDDKIAYGSYQAVFASFNPYGIVKLLKYPNILFADLACGLLSWTQYSMLAAPREIITVRFHLDTPLIAGLYYIAPAAGFLTGTLIGGRWSDHTVRKWIKVRGHRVPHDRLKSCWFAFFLIIPAASLIQGWCLQFDVGELALPIVMAYFVAAGLLLAFASLNTYCAEVMPTNRMQVIANKYLVQYLCAASASVGAVPLLEAIGVGWSSVLNSAFVIIGGILTFSTARYGASLQAWAD